MDGRVFNDFYHYMSENDESFEKFMKRKRGRGDGENAFKYRLLHKGYAGNVFSDRYSQEVVIKVIGRGYATKHLSTLLKYIAREQEHQKGKEKATIFDCYGNEINPEDFEKLVKEWKQDFDYPEKELDKITLDGINELNKFYSFLNDKKYEERMSDLGVEIYNNIKKLLDKRIATKTEFAENSFIFNKENYTYGFINQVLKDGDLEVAAFLENGDIRLEKVEKENAQDITYEVQKNHRYMPKNFTHMIISPGGDNVNKAKTIKATERYLKKELAARGYEYVWAMHEDTENLHFHVIVKSKSFLREQGKFVLNKFDLHAMRLSYARDLDAYGIDRTATLKYDRPSYMQILKDKAENVRRTEKEWWDYKLSESDNKNFDALKFRKNSIKNLDYFTNKMKDMGEHKAARILRQQRERFMKLEVHDADKVIEDTALKLNYDNEDFGDFFKRELITRMGDPEQYTKDKREKIVKQISKEFLDHVRESRREINDMSEKHMNEEMLERKMQATLQLAAMESEIKKIRGMDAGRGM